MDGRLLTELKVADLRQELEKRHKDKGGVKQVLVDRLREALEDDGHDPASFRFGLEPEVVGPEAEITEQMSVNGDETDVEKNPCAKDLATDNLGELPRTDSINEEQTEPKKIAEDPVTYVVQVDQEEDLDYDLKTENNEQSDTKEVQQQSGSSETTEPKQNEVQPASGKSTKGGIENRRNLWVSNLPRTVKAAHLKQHFSRVGKVLSATVVMSTRSPGGCFGFLQMGTAEDACNAARKFDGSEFNGYKLSVEATERKPPTLSLKSADRPGAGRGKLSAAKPDAKRSIARSRLALQKRSYRAAQRNQLRRAPYRPPVVDRRKVLEPPVPPVRPTRIIPNFLAYQSLKRARLLAASRYGMARGLQTLERSVPRSRISRTPPSLPRPVMRYSSEMLPPVRRYSIPERREPRPPTRPEPPVRRPDPRPPIMERRRPVEPIYFDERTRPSAPPRTAVPRRSEPMTRQPIRPREMAPVSPIEGRRLVQPSSAPRSFEMPSRYDRSGRPSEELSRTFVRPSDPPRSRVDPRSADRLEFMRQSRGLPNGNKDSFSPPFGHSRHRAPVVSPSPRPVPARSHASARGSPTQPRRELRNVSRSPPRSRNMALVRPYPEVSPQHRSGRMSRDRSPLHGSGSRPKVVDYGHRSEPRDDWPNWRDNGPGIPSGHTWKPAGHSFVSNYASRGSGRRY